MRFGAEAFFRVGFFGADLLAGNFLREAFVLDFDFGLDFDRSRAGFLRIAMDLKNYQTLHLFENRN